MSILNSTVSPVSTLMSVAKPWIDASPAPLTSHSEAGLPGRQFSATISLSGVSHGPAAETGEGEASGIADDTMRQTSASTAARCRAFETRDIEGLSSRSGFGRTAFLTHWPAAPGGHDGDLPRDYCARIGAIEPKSTCGVTESPTVGALERAEVVRSRTGRTAPKRSSLVSCSAGYPVANTDTWSPTSP